MTGWRQVVRRVLPVVLAATCMLVPGISARPVHKAKRAGHYVAKHQSRQASSRRARAPKRKVEHRAVTRRAPAHRAKRSRRYHRTAYHRRYRRHHFRIPARPSSDRIEQIQRALSRTGYYQGDPTGRWDSDTVAAMKNFQQAHGISPTGKIDAPSLQQLGLGSDVAGLAPPRPVISTNPPDSAKESKGAGSR
jgi:hypothetical protein